MKKKILKVFVNAVASAFCLLLFADVSVHANSYSYYEYYDQEYPGYYTVEPVVRYVQNPDLEVYDNCGNFLYYQAVPDTEFVEYEEVWHPGWIETKRRKVTVTYIKNPDTPVYDAYGNFWYYESNPGTKVVSYEDA